MQIGLGKETRKTYGFDEIALVPSGNTLDLELCDTSWQLAGHQFKIPILASAMDSVVSPESALAFSQQEALPVINLQGIYFRYANYQQVLEEICRADKNKFVALMQDLYREPIKEELIYKIIERLKSSSKPVAVSITPQSAENYLQILQEAGVDLLFVQSTVVGLSHESVKCSSALDLAEFCKRSKIPVIVGNCVNYRVALELMHTGIAGLLVGIGPGAACTSRGVLGIGVPMATAIADCRKARDDFYAANNHYVPIIADGGMANGGDICKAIACGADAVMIGSPFARTQEAPANGFHWGMATPSPVLPRGTRIEVGTDCSVEVLLHGPATRDDGLQNFVGALKASMATLGAKNLKEMQDVEVIVAPSILTEGKVYQQAQKLGMGR